MSKSAIVIGSGFGGLAAALRLIKLGYSVTILEKLEQLGGRAQCFKMNGYSFDAGPTVITAPFLFEELFKLHNRSLDDYVELLPVEPWYQFRFADGTEFNYGGEVDDTLDEIRKISPSDANGYLKLLDDSKKIFKVGFEELADKPFHNLGFMLKQLSFFIRLKCYRTVWKFVCSHLKHDHLRRAFSIQPLLVGGNPFDTTCIYSLIHYLERKWGIWYPRGGTTSLVKALGKLIKEVGGEIRLNCTVKQILIENNAAKGVLLENGEKIYSDIVVSNSDPIFTYKNLVKEEYRNKWSNKRLSKLKLSMGLYVLYFGTNRKYNDVKHHTILFGNEYESLLNKIFKKGELSEDLSLYLHRPTASDQNLAPDGHDAFYVLAPVPNLKHVADWKVKKEQVRKNILKILEEKILPDLSESIDTIFEFTPSEFESQYCSAWGAGFSISPIFTQSAYFRFHNQSEDIDNLFFVGAGTHPGAGVPGVISSAKVVESILKESDSQFITQGVAHA